MSAKNPFLFATDQGNLLEVKKYPIIGVGGLNILKASIELLPPKSPTRQSFENVYAYLQTLQKTEILSSNKINDLSAQEKVWLNQRTSDKIYNSYKTCVYILLPGPNKSNFTPTETLETTSPSPQTFKWDVEHLVNDWKVVASLAKKEEIYFPSNLLSTILKAKKEWERGTLSARFPEPEADLARNDVYVVLNKRHGKYVTPQSNLGNLAQARMFETKAAAEKYIEKKTYEKHKENVVVSAQLRLTETFIPDLPSDMHALFQDALARMQKEEIQKALEESTLASLQERVRQMQEERPVATTSPKKRM